MAAFPGANRQTGSWDSSIPAESRETASWPSVASRGPTGQPGLVPLHRIERQCIKIPFPGKPHPSDGQILSIPLLTLCNYAVPDEHHLGASSAKRSPPLGPPGPTRTVCERPDPAP